MRDVETRLKRTGRSWAVRLVWLGLASCSSTVTTTSVPGPIGGPAAVTPNLPGPSSVPASPSTAVPPLPTMPPTPTVSSPAPAMPSPAIPEKPQPGSAPTALMPCAVAAVVANQCQSCHGATPIGGAPMSLLSHADFHKPAPTRSDLTVFQLSRTRIADMSRPMPPSGTLPAAELATLDGWLAAGAPAGTAADATCAPIVPAPGSGGPVMDDPRAGLAPIEGETCYDFPNHGAEDQIDDSPYMIRTGEHYHQFYFKPPWPDGVVATRFGARFDNLQVLHHWLMLSSGKPLSMAGTHEDHGGSQFGEDARLLAGWAVGGNSFIAPKDVGLKLPSPNTLVHTQWHFYNSTGEPQADRSVVQICTVPASERKNIASLTWLGSEAINLRAGVRSDVSGTCTNDSNAPINIIAFWPHMHQLGRNMRSVVRRKNGMMEEVFNKPFQFDHQYYYGQEPNVVLAPGESITSTCTFDNDTDDNVTFGESTRQEMCYQFTIAYPAHALDNGVFSLIGVNDTCW